MSSALRERDNLLREMSDLSSLTPELDSEIRLAEKIIADCGSYVLEDGSGYLGKAIAETYKMALEVKDKYVKASRRSEIERTLESGEHAGIFIDTERNSIMVYPAVYFDDTSREGLARSLLDYCIERCNRFGLKADTPERHKEYTKIRVTGNQNTKTGLKEALSSGKPKGFDQANIDLAVILLPDYRMGNGYAGKHDGEPANMIHIDPSKLNSMLKSGEIIGIITAAGLFRETGIRFGNTSDQDSLDAYVPVIISHSKEGVLNVYYNGNERYVNSAEFHRFLGIEKVEQKLRNLKKGRTSLDKASVAETLGVKSFLVNDRIKEGVFETDDSGHVRIASIVNYISNHPVLEI